MNLIQFCLNRLKKLIFTLVFLALGYLPNISQAACTFTNLASGATVNGPFTTIGGVISEIEQNKSAAKHKEFRYHLSCPNPSSKVKITIIDDFSQTPLYEKSLKPAIENFNTVLKPTLFVAETRIRLIPQNGGQILSSMFDPPNNRITGNTGTFHYQGPLELTLVVTNGNKYLFSNIYKPSMRWEFLEYYPINIEIEDKLSRRNTVVFISDEFRPNSNKCDVAGFIVTATPNKINFNLSKQSLEQGMIAQRDFSLNITRNESNCSAPLRPKVIFTTPETIINNQDIKLSNGLLLSLKDGANGRPLEIGKVIEYYNQIDTSLQIKYKAELRKNPGEAIKSGPFSTALVYLVEYY